MVVILFILGLLFLIIGAELLVRGASRLATAVGISPLVIGLTVVAFGTSSPELAVSIKSALSGQASIALGNVIGSNIFNVLFILGLSAIIVPLIVSKQLVRLDVPLMIILSLFVFFISLDNRIGRLDGLILLIGVVSYCTFLIMQSRKEQASDESSNPDVDEKETNRWPLNILLVIIGLTLLVFGSRWLVDSATTFAQHLGVSELIIGLTIIAAGTSLPEVVTSLIAALRGERDIAVGNVVGSNIFNLMAVLGFASVFSPSGIDVSPSIIQFDLPIMVAVAFACLPIFFTGGVISRREGSVLFFYYVAYTLYLVLASTHHDALDEFSSVMLYFVVPITLLTLLIVLTREFGWNRKGRVS